MKDDVHAPAIKTLRLGIAPGDMSAQHTALAIEQKRRECDKIAAVVRHDDRCVAYGFNRREKNLLVGFGVVRRRIDHVQSPLSRPCSRLAGAY